MYVVAFASLLQVYKEGGIHNKLLTQQIFLLQQLSWLCTATDVYKIGHCIETSGNTPW